jgi:hypothetical protein
MFAQAAPAGRPRALGTYSRGSPMPDDFLTDFWHVLKAHVGTAAADTELIGLRQRWGGSRIYFKVLPNFHRVETSYEPRRLRERKK